MSDLTREILLEKGWAPEYLDKMETLECEVFERMDVVGELPHDVLESIIVKMTAPSRYPRYGALGVKAVGDKARAHLLDILADEYEGPMNLIQVALFSGRYIIPMAPELHETVQDAVDRTCGIVWGNNRHAASLARLLTSKRAAGRTLEDEAASLRVLMPFVGGYALRLQEEMFRIKADARLRMASRQLNELKGSRVLGVDFRKGLLIGKRDRRSSLRDKARQAMEEQDKGA